MGRPKYYQNLLPLLESDGGSPLLDKNGNVVAINISKSNNTSMSLAVPKETLQEVLEKIEGIHLIRCERKFGFTFQMTPEEKKEAAEYYTKHFHQVLIQVKKLSLETLQNLEKIEQQKIGRKKSENTNSPNIFKL